MGKCRTVCVCVCPNNEYEVSSAMAASKLTRSNPSIGEEMLAESPAAPSAATRQPSSRPTLHHPPRPPDLDAIHSPLCQPSPPSPMWPQLRDSSHAKSKATALAPPASAVLTAPCAPTRGL
eukprot:2894766-Amphidinium_carterae.1